MQDKTAEQSRIQAAIATHWTDADGKSQTVAPHILQQLNTLMAQALAENHISHDAKALLPAVKILVHGHPVNLTLTGSDEYHWTLTTDTGSQYQGKTSGQNSLILPVSLPTGYHHLALSSRQQRWDCTIIVTPERCYEPPVLQAGNKLWGSCIQLYTLRSTHNWGCGDFGDLARTIKQLSRHGAAFIGLNPLHALYPAQPDRASPYSPSSRLWLNIIYIDVNAVDEFQHSKPAQQWWHQTKTQALLTEIRSSEWVDYPRVMQLKLTALRLAFPLFMARAAEDTRTQAFRQFVVRGGDSLQQQAIFDALHNWLSEKTPGLAGWTSWPAQYQDPASSDVNDFCHQQNEKITFYLWLQWLADSQLAHCCQVSRQQNMPIGLYLDMAVGVTQDSAETWGDRTLYCLQASTGAPPDRIGPSGQDWQLAPVNPQVLTARIYQPFIDLLRASMVHGGALRLDHVMSLLRLWWIPHGQEASHGAYVHYPLDDLLGILALESQRHHCLIIGEDLGIVPPEIVTRLHDYGIYSYKVLYFEQDSEHHFRSPQQYPRQAMATLNTHDLPTLRGYWQADDLTLGHQLGIYPNQQLMQQYIEREKSKQGLLDALHLYDCLPDTIDYRTASVAMNPIIAAGLQRYLSVCASALLGLQPEDWMDMAIPVNIPGTCDEYPNWRRKLCCTLETLFSDPRIIQLLLDISQYRKQTNLPRN